MVQTSEMPAEPSPGRGTVKLSDGVDMFYTDSGRPSAPIYHTIFAIHGMGLNAGSFQKMQSAAAQSGVRLVALNRRNYAGSTPYSKQELVPLNAYSELGQVVFMKARGIEILSFILQFIKQNQTPSIQSGGQGGISMVGWSLGIAFLFAAISNMHSLPAEDQALLSSYTKKAVILDGGYSILGFDKPPEAWMPTQQGDNPAQILDSWYEWMTAYFDHEDTSSKQKWTLNWTTPSIRRRSSISDIKDTAPSIMEPNGITADVVHMKLPVQLKRNYQKACYGPTIRNVLPNMKVVMVTGLSSHAFAIDAMWSVQQDNDEYGGSSIKFEVVPEANHFMIWDYPEVVLSLCMRDYR